MYLAVVMHVSMYRGCGEKLETKTFGCVTDKSPFEVGPADNIEQFIL